MQLPHLTQTVLLDRHMAGLVHTYLAGEQRSLLRRNPDAGQRLSTTEALSLAPLAKLLRDLDKLHKRDQLPLKPPTRKPKTPRPPKPHRLKVACAEMATLRFYYARMLASAGCHPDSYQLLQAALGRFHQPSLNVESHVSLADATRLPGYQANFFA